MKYWVIIANRQQGPYELEDLKLLPLTPNTPVWHEGLPQWVPAVQVKEVMDILNAEEQQQAENTAENPTDAEENFDNSAEQATEENGNQGNENDSANAGNYSYSFVNAGYQNAGSNAQRRMDTLHEGQRPDSYLAWAIIVTILCCLPCGIVSIIYATMVNSRFDRGDVEGAKKASETAQMWIILSITLGLLVMPIQVALQLL